MTTRAASASISRRVKQNLVNKLFKSDYGGKGRDAHLGLDFASYTYMDLRNAYLTRIKSIHPDRAMHDSENSTKDNTNNQGEDENKATGTFENNIEVGNKKWDDITNLTRRSKKKNHEEFVELQEAWDAYDKIAKAMQKGQSDSHIRGVQENFTLFGVGCSFSDSVEESNKRAEIMDQAGKGWCSAGQLSDSSSDDKMTKNSKMDSISLIDDEMFEIQTDEDRCASYNEKGQKAKRKSLIDFYDILK